MPLSMTTINSEHIIKKIYGSHKIKKHLESLGFVIGQNIKVISVQCDNLVVNILESRIALSKAIANNIFV